MMRNSTTPPQTLKPSPARSLAGNSSLRGGGSNSRNTSQADFQESAEFIVEALRQLDFPRDLSSSAFIDKVSVQGILEVTNFLLQKIDGTTRVDTLEDVPAFLRFLKYPSTILQRSQWNVGGMSSGKHLLPIYHWLTQLILFDSTAIHYPELGTSEVLEMLRTSYEGTAVGSSRDQEILHGICQYMVTSGLLENPSEGHLWEEYTIRETDVEDFLATITRLDPASVQETWTIVARFHEHLIWSMTRHLQQETEGISETVTRMRKQKQDAQILKSTYESLKEKLTILKGDLSTSTAQLEDMAQNTRRMLEETNTAKANCVARQQEINNMNSVLTQLRKQTADQGLSFTEAERMRSDTNNKLQKAEGLQQECATHKTRILESERQLRERFKDFSATWKEFVYIVMNKASSHLPNHECVTKVVGLIQDAFQQSQNKPANRSLLTREIGFRLDYDNVVAHMSHPQDGRRADSSILNDILRIDTQQLWYLIEDLHKVIRRDALQDLKARMEDERLKCDLQRTHHETRLEHDVALLAKRQRELEKISQANESLELLKSDREKSMLEEVMRAEEQLDQARRKHQAVLESQTSDQAKEARELKDYAQKVDSERRKLQKAQEDFATSREQTIELMKKLSVEFKNAIIDVTLSLPTELTQTFPSHLQQALGVGRAVNDEAIEVAEVAEEMDISSESECDEEGEVDNVGDENAETGICCDLGPSKGEYTRPLQQMISRFANLGTSEGFPRR